MGLFKSKILLFGEYGLIHNSRGLTIPYEKFEGKLTFSPQKLKGDDIKNSNKSLEMYANHLQELVKEKKLPFTFNIDKFKSDIEKGIIFDSDIPQGFGVGSSGALVASIYLNYVDGARGVKEQSQSMTKEQVLDLKNNLRLMESYFHGSSSGIDPLICFLQEPLLINNSSDIDTIKIPELESAEKKGAIFLINTGKPGVTKNLVNIFNEKCKDEKYLELVQDHFIPFTNDCIDHFITGNVKGLLNDVKKISKFMLSHLSPMVPDEFKSVIKKGLDTGKYTVKLCGSGGGGYLLGFTENLEEALKELKGHQIELIQRI